MLYSQDHVGQITEAEDIRFLSQALGRTVRRNLCSRGPLSAFVSRCPMQDRDYVRRAVRKRQKLARRLNRK